MYQAWDRKGYVFQYLPARKGEAQVTILWLIPLLRYKFGDNIVKWFIPDAVKKMEMEKYDVNSGEGSSIMDEYISVVKAGDAKFNLVRELPQNE